MAYISKFTGAQIDDLLEKSKTMGAAVDELAQDVAAKEDVTNKVTTLEADATDEQYPSAKAVKEKLDELHHKVGREEEIKRQSGYIDLSVGVGGIVDVTPKVSTSGFKYSFSEFPEGSYARMYGAGGSGASVRLWAILDKDYKILSVADSALNVTNLRIDAPEGSAYLVTNDQDNKSFFVFNGNSIELRKADKEYVNKKIDSVSKRIDDLDKVNYETTFVDVDSSMLLNTRLNIDGSTSSNQSSYKVFVIDVEEGESYKIVQPKNLGSTGSALYALYSDRNFVLQNLMYVGKEFGNIQEEFFVIPSGCHYLLVGAVTTNYADIKKCVIKARTDIISESSSKYKLYVKVDGNSIRVTKKYNTSKNFQVTIKPCGASSLPQIYSFGWIKNDSNIISKSDCANPVLSGSDWVMPWQLWSRENSTHVGHGFCGGWHGYNGIDCNGQIGNPTAVNDSVKFYADGIELEDGVGRYADEVKVVVKNRIMAQNSLSDYNGENDGYYVLEEIVTYLFKDNKIFISVIASALKNIDVNLYYGLATNKFCSEIVYFGESIKKATFDSASYFEEPCFSFACKDTANNYVIASMNSVGIGMYKHAKEGRYAMAFDYGKAYFSLIDTSKPLTLSIGDSLYWKGSLNFVDSLDIN